VVGGLGWTVRLVKAVFIGRQAIQTAKEAGLGRKLLGLVLDGDRIARPGHAVESGGKPAGRVTSGSMGISIGRPVAMAYLEGEAATVGARVDVTARGQNTPATVASRPMYRNGSVRSPKPRRTA
jgi:aminomethyltransferase